MIQPNLLLGWACDTFALLVISSGWERVPDTEMLAVKNIFLASINIGSWTCRDCLEIDLEIREIPKVWVEVSTCLAFA